MSCRVQFLPSRKTKKCFLVLLSVIVLTSSFLWIRSILTHSFLFPGYVGGETTYGDDIYPRQASMTVNKKLDFLPRNNFRNNIGLPVDNPEVDTVLQILDQRHLTGIIAIDDFRRQRNGAYFNEDKFISDLLVDNDDLIEDLFVVLKRNEKLEILSDVNNPFMKSKPQGVLNRMAAIDILKAILDSEPSSIRHPKVIKGLQDMIMSPLSDQRNAENASTLGDRFDALVLLGQRNPADALACFQFLKTSGHENIFKRALITGLKNHGLSIKDIYIMIGSLSENDL